MIWRYLTLQEPPVGSGKNKISPAWPGKSGKYRDNISCFFQCCINKRPLVPGNSQVRSQCRCGWGNHETNGGVPRSSVWKTSYQSNPQMTSLRFSSSSPPVPLSPGLHPSVAIMLCPAPIFCHLFWKGQSQFYNNMFMWFLFQWTVWGSVWI